MTNVECQSNCRISSTPSKEFLPSRCRWHQLLALYECIRPFSNELNRSSAYNVENSYLSGLFLPRNAMHKRSLCRHAVSVCPSVRPSVTFVDHVKTNYISSKFFHHRVATPFWFFQTKRGGDIPTGTPLTGASNAKGYEKITIFDQYLAVSRDWWKPHPFWMTLSDL